MNAPVKVIRFRESVNFGPSFSNDAINMTPQTEQGFDRKHLAWFESVVVDYDRRVVVITPTKGEVQEVPFEMCRSWKLMPKPAAFGRTEKAKVTAPSAA